MRTRRFLIGSLLGILSLSAVASAALSSIGGADVQFLAVGPAGLKIQGSTTELSASETDGKLSVVVPLGNIKTGIGLRDEHFKRDMDVAKYPKATLVVERSKLKFPEDNQTQEGEAPAQLTLHGVTRPIKLQYTTKRTGSDYHVQGKFDLDIRDYKIEKPCYLGVCVDPNVKIKSKFKLREK